MTDSVLRNYAIGIILFATIITGGISMFQIMMEDNSEYLSQDDIYYQAFSNELDILDESTEIGNEFIDDVEEVDGDSGGDGSFLDSLFGGSWKTIQNFGKKFEFMTSIYRGTAELFGIPSWIVVVITSLIATMITFAIFTAIFQRRL